MLETAEEEPRESMTLKKMDILLKASWSPTRDVGIATTRAKKTMTRRDQVISRASPLGLKPGEGYTAMVTAR